MYRGGGVSSQVPLYPALCCITSPSRGPGTRTLWAAVQGHAVRAVGAGRCRGDGVSEERLCLS